VIEAMRKAGKRLPVTVQVTLQESGTMLLGTEIGAALTALEPYDVDVIGLNCATGPAEMNEAVRYLALNSTKQASVLPNAGLPQNEGGHAGRASEIPQTFRRRLRCPHCRRMLRHASGTSQSCSRCGLRRRAGEKGSEARRCRIERLYVRPA